MHACMYSFHFEIVLDETTVVVTFFASSNCILTALYASHTNNNYYCTVKLARMHLSPIGRRGFRNK